MLREPVDRTLERHGIQPSAQRRAIAAWVLSSTAHPSADRVFEVVRARTPGISRATVYNTLNLLVRKGLLRELVLAEGAVVFDPKLEPHHHFVDDSTGEIVDVPWDALEVQRVGALRGLDVREYQVVLRGRRRRVVRRGSGAHRSAMGDQKQNEGEGSRTADRRYREGVKETVRRGHVTEDAERARKDVEAEPEEYREAERQGRERSAGDAPGDLER